MIKLKKTHSTLNCHVVGFELNCHVVGFDIGCHEAIITF